MLLIKWKKVNNLHTAEIYKTGVYKDCKYISELTQCTH